jgi:hypothetical protein
MRYLSVRKGACPPLCKRQLAQAENKKFGLDHKIECLTLGFSGAARTRARYVAGKTMERMLSPRPLQAIVGRRRYTRVNQLLFPS